MGVDLGAAAVMTLEAEAVRGHEAVQILERREVHRALRGGGEPGHPAALDMLLVDAGQSVTAVVDPGPEHPRPLGFLRRQVVRHLPGMGGAEQPQPAGRSGTARRHPLEKATAEQSAATRQTILVRAHDPPLVARWCNADGPVAILRPWFSNTSYSHSHM